MKIILNLIVKNFLIWNGIEIVNSFFCCLGKLKFFFSFILKFLNILVVLENILLMNLEYWNVSKI